MLPKSQKGFIHLGLFGVLLLVGAVAVGARLVSNPELIFNIGEKAKAPEGREACEAAGCPWEWKKGRCKKTEKNCGGSAKSGNFTCTGGSLRCVAGEGTGACSSQGLVSQTGSCNKGEVCCGPRVPDKETEDEETTLTPQEVKIERQENLLNQPPSGGGTECAVGEADQTVSCSPGAGCSTGKGEKRQKCENGKWVDKSVGGCSCTGGSCTTQQGLDCSAQLKACENGKCVTTSPSNSTSTGGGGTKCIYGNCEVPIGATSCAQGTRCDLGCNSQTGKCYPPSAKEYGTLCGPVWRVTGWWRPGDAHTFGNMRAADFDACPLGCNKSTGNCNSAAGSEICVTQCIYRLGPVCIVSNPLAPKICL